MPRDTPLIGLTGTHQDAFEQWGGPYRSLACETAFFEPIFDAGGTPVVLPANPGHVESVIGHLDAVLLTGGTDIAPTRYGQDRQHHSVRSPDLHRDAFEIALVRAAIDGGLPVLGICRGMQLINVALGGTLHQHVEGHLRLDASAHPVQSVTLTQGSRLHELFGADRITVNSLHHQAVAELGDDLTVVARSSDGTIEGIEHTSVAAVGIQWHPEKLADDAGYRLLAGWLLEQSVRARAS